MKNFLKHLYFAFKYGEWDMGWDKTWGEKEDEPFFYCKHIYYDGDYWGLRIGKFFIGVSY